MAEGGSDGTRLAGKGNGEMWGEARTSFEGKEQMLPLIPKYSMISILEYYIQFPGSYIMFLE